MVELTAKGAAKRARVIEAACLVFRRHGFARTSMDLIAEASEMSRPALYLVFSNKEEVFAAAVHHMGDVAIERLRASLDDHQTLQEQLVFVCDEWAGGGFDRLQANPDAKDITDPRFAPVREVYAKLQDFLAELLAKAVARSDIGATPSQVAGILVASMRGFKEAARDGVEIRQMIELQIAVLIRALAPKRSRPKPAAAAADL